MTGWRIPLRIARREATRAKGRSILMLVMIALPVMGVAAADILIQTQDVNSVESLDRRLGTEAAARVTSYAGGPETQAVEQSVDPDSGGYGSGPGDPLPVPTLDSVLAALGGDRSGIEVTSTYPVVRVDKGARSVSATTLDVHDPLAHGLFRLADGRWPKNADEVVVNGTLAARGPGIGDQLAIAPADSPDQVDSVANVERTVVGIAESTSYRDSEQVVGLPGSIPTQDGEVSWLVGGGKVTWDDVRKLNAIGTLVISRAEIEHPSAGARAANQMYDPPSVVDESTVTLAVLVVVMALIEVVLLAGPAFAVGARRQARPLALLAACGGTPAQARRVVLATGVVIGTAGAVVGVVAGIFGAFALTPVLQNFNGTVFGPFQVPWWHLLGVAFFGLASALLAAVVPAWIASRQDVVAVLAGRRGDPKPSARSPYVGVVLLGIGIVCAALGTERAESTSAALIGLSAICCVLGMVFIVPVVVAGIAKLGRFLPLALRFAVRDAARHRTRTTPAVAAVAATVMGVVALGIGTSSDEKRNAEQYLPLLPGHSAMISADDQPGKTPPWDEYAAVLERETSGVTAEPVLGVPYLSAEGQSRSFSLRGPAGPEDYLNSVYNSTLSTEMLVYDGTLPSIVTAVDGFDATAARKVLDAGGMVVFVDDGDPVPRVSISLETFREDADGPEAGKPLSVPSIAFDLHSRAPAQGIIPVALARRLGVPAVEVGLVSSGARITEAQEKNVSEGLQALTPKGHVYVERGYQPSSDKWLIQLVLAGLGALLMLGGTLTATFLALSDARPDLATLSAVGAAPRTRRAVAAGYALSVGFVGAVLGVVIGFVPGIAATYPITAAAWNPCTSQGCAAAPDHYLAVPWLLVLGVVVLLPLLTAAVVWLSARSRLPLVSRLT